MQTQDPTEPDKTRHPLKNATSTHEKPDKTRQPSKIHPGLSIEQEHAINFLMQGKSDREVAGAIGVTRQTICQWRNHNPAVSAELDRRRQVVWGSHLEQLRRLAGKAIEVLEDDLAIEGSDACITEAERRLRQTAALHVLRASGIFGNTPRPSQPDEIFEED